MCLPDVCYANHPSLEPSRIQFRPAVIELIARRGRNLTDSGRQRQQDHSDDDGVFDSSRAIFAFQECDD